MNNIVKITLKNDLNIQINTEDTDYLKLIKERFTKKVEGYHFMPAYRSGSWNGETCMIRKNNSLPYGLLADYIRIHRKEFARIPLMIEDEVKYLFQGPKLKIKYDLSLKPYPYQEDCILKSIHRTKGIIRSATASGKSLIIAYILKTLLENNRSKQSIIVVPNKGLVEQFYKNMMEYEMKYSVGRVWQKSKEWDEQIVISTWQTLMKHHHELQRYGCIIIDECLDSDTIIKTIDGEKRIEDIKIGEEIISYNISKNIYEKDVVVNVYKNSLNSRIEKMYELEFDNGKKIKITGNHKILTTKGYIRADKLAEKHEIISLEI